MGPRSHVLSSILPLSFLLSAEPIWAAKGVDSAVEQQGLSYDVPTVCPSEAAFRAQILARTPAARFGPSRSREDGLQFDVSARKTSSGWEAKLEVRSGDSSSTRQVPGATCEEAVSGLALVTALIIDPTADTGEVRPEGEPEREAEPTTATLPRTPAPPRKSGWRLGLQAQAGLLWAPRTSFGGGLVLQLLEFEEQASPLRLHLMARLGASATGTFPTEFDGDASFTEGILTVGTCPLGWGTHRRGVWLCAVGVGGAVMASGRNLPNPETSATPQLGGGPGLLFSWSLGRTHLELAVDAPVAFIQTRFFFEPDRDLYTTPWVTPRLNLGCSWDL